MHRILRGSVSESDLLLSHNLARFAITVSREPLEADSWIAKQAAMLSSLSFEAASLPSLICTSLIRSDPMYEQKAYGMTW